MEPTNNQVASSSKLPSDSGGNFVTPTRPPQPQLHVPHQQGQSKPLSSVPQHIRSEARPSAPSGPSMSKPTISNADRRNSNTTTNTIANTESSTSSKNINPSPIANQHLQSNPNQKSRPAHTLDYSSKPEPPSENRKVSFAEPPAPPQRQQQFAQEPPPHHKAQEPPTVSEPLLDDDESFHFYSDDDAFLAAVDLGEGDLGRPIDFEEGLDGYTSIDSGIDMSCDDVKSTGGTERKPQQPQPHLNPLNASTSSHNQSSSMHGTRQGQARAGQRSTGTDPENAASSGAATGIISRAIPHHELPQALQQPSGETSSGTKQLVRTTYQNQNQDPSHRSSTTSTASTFKPVITRPSPPSMGGGFHFPPGVVSTMT